MDSRNLGASGLRVSLVGLGCNNFGARLGREASFPVIHRAIDAGITLFDTADIYGNRGGSEEIIGEALGERRKDIVLATKFAKPMDDAGRLAGASRRYIVMAVEASLRRLRTDWIDLYQMHDPPDGVTPIEETLRALDDLIRAGKVRYVGCSNFRPWQIVEAQLTARSLGTNAFIATQDEYSLLNRHVETDTIPVARSYGLGFLPFFPLAGGLLTGKYRKGEAPPAGARLAAAQRSNRFLNPQNLDKVEALRAFAEERGHTLLELAFAWLTSEPAVASVIAGATSPAQVDANIAAAAWQLTGEERAAVGKLTAGLMASATDFVALLRGINVGGHKPIKMDAIRAAFAGMGFVEPRTVLASGNVVFETEGAEEGKLRRLIEEQLAARTGQPIGVLIRPIAELEALISADPFAGAQESADSKLYVTFLSEPAKRPIELPYRGPNSEFTILKAGPREVISVGRFAKSAPFLDKVYGKATTTRNWNTVYRIVAAAS